MATSNELLKQIYKELQERFTNHPYISIKPDGDDAPEKYVITYNILGIVQNSSSQLEEIREHSILINIPFGFPHFPPSCTPQSSVFHPDFDQAAICIGEFWNKEKTLSELVIHLGEMILGKIYSTESPFNETALTWYQENKEKLPFEDIDLKKTYDESSEITDGEDESNSGDDLGDDLTHAIDTLDDSDIQSDNDFLETEAKPDDEGRDTDFPTIKQASGKSSINRVHLLVRQKRYYELSLFLEDIPEDNKFEDREKIEEKVASFVNEATKLHQTGVECENFGETQKALELFTEAATIVPDFPDIQECINRAKKSTDLQDDYQHETQEEDKSRDIKKASAKKDKTKRKVTFFDDSNKTSLNVPPIIFIGFGVLIFSVVLFLYFSAGSKLNKSNIAYKQCVESLEKGLFAQTQKNCETASGYLDKISFFKSNEKDLLTKKINKTMNSRKFTEGISGRVLFQDRYVDKADIEILKKFNKEATEADKIFSEKSWGEAVKKYEQAQQTIQPIVRRADNKRIESIKNNLLIAKVNILIERGEDASQKGDLTKAKSIYTSTLKSLEKINTETSKNLIALIEDKIHQVDYLEYLNLGKKFFVSSDWKKSIKQYEKALQLGADISLTDEEAAKLHANMAEAELYALISQAKQDLGASKWDQAVKQYRKALKLLQMKKNLLISINPEEIELQIRRIILRTEIVQNKKMADDYLQKREYGKAESTFRGIINTIRSQGFADDKEFNPIIKGMQEAIAKVSEEKKVAGKIAYLVTNYKEIFVTHYSGAIPEYLSKPKATFKKNIGNKELFELQCLEKKPGRQLRLVIFYLYDPKTKSWSFYHENQQ